MNFWQELKQQNRPILCSAPIDGVSDFAFCKICLDYGADVVFTEMTSVNDLYYESKQLITYLKLFKGTHKVVVQLYGKNPEQFTKAAQIIEDLGFDGIDINFGCPAKGVTASGGGVMLMRDLDNVYKIIENTLKGTKLPVSIKIRAGINIDSIKKHQLSIADETFKFIHDKEKITALDLLRKVENLPISCVTIHGRTFEQLFSGEINYELIKKCKSFIKSPIILVNGGIKDEDSTNKVIKLTNADGAMIGVATFGKPYIFNELKGIKNNDIKNVIIKHAEYLFYSKPSKAHLDFRKHLLWYLKDYPELRKEIVSIQNISDIKNIIEKL